MRLRAAPRATRMRQTARNPEPAATCETSMATKHRVRRSRIAGMLRLPLSPLRETHLARRRRADRRRAGDAAARCASGRAGGHVPGAGQDQQRRDPLPGVSVVFKNGDAVAAATSTETDGTLSIHGQARSLSRVRGAFGGFSPVERDVTLDGASCGQTMDFQLTLLARTAARRREPGRPRAWRRANGKSAVRSDGGPAAGRRRAGRRDRADREAEESAARQLLPPGFSSERRRRR